MYNFDRIKDMIYREMDGISDEGQLTFDCVQALGEMVDILKDISTVEAMEESNYGYSNNDGYSQRGRKYYDGNSYGGSSYGRGGNGSSMRSSYNGGYSRDDGTKRDMVQKLENLWNETRDEHDKEAIKRLLDQMR